MSEGVGEITEITIREEYLQNPEGRLIFNHGHVPEILKLLGEKEGSLSDGIKMFITNDEGMPLEFMIINKQLISDNIVSNSDPQIQNKLVGFADAEIAHTTLALKSKLAVGKRKGEMISEDQRLVMKSLLRQAYVTAELISNVVDMQRKALDPTLLTKVVSTFGSVLNCWNQFAEVDEKIFESTQEEVYCIFDMASYLEWYNQLYSVENPSN